jgi:hypothetical protein
MRNVKMMRIEEWYLLASSYMPQNIGVDETVPYSIDIGG